MFLTPEPQQDLQINETEPNYITEWALILAQRETQKEKCYVVSDCKATENGSLSDNGEWH